MTPEAEDKCKDFFGFAASNGYCYVTGIQRAAVMAIVVEVKASSSSLMAQMQADVKVTASKMRSGSGSISDTLKRSLKNTPWTFMRTTVALTTSLTQRL